MQRSAKPIHFVISKWDTLINEYSLEQVRERLLEIEDFRNLIQLRNKSGVPVRLIPISSVGMGFAELQPDGSMAKTGNLPNPFLVEMPLACILPDMIKITQINKIKTENIIFTIAVTQNKGKTIIASGHNKGVITAWNLELQDEIYHTHGHQLKVNSLAFSPQGDILASGSEDKSIKLWNSNTGELISKLGMHLDSVNSIVFSSDGKILASGSDDCTVKIWDVQKQIEITELEGHNEGVTSVSFSLDGETLVSGSKDKTIRLWKRL